MAIETYSTDRGEAGIAPIILSAPHGGRCFDPAFLAQSPLGIDALLETADLGTDALVKDHNVGWIAARFARSFVDLNRPRQWLDPAVVRDMPPRSETQIAAGYGVIPRFASRGFLTHSGKVTRVEAENRLRDYYDPYHFALRGRLNRIIGVYGRAILIDVHSAPSGALGRVELQFGTQYGRTMATANIEAIIQCFDAEGLATSRDFPFAGGHITQSYADAQVETVQIEINRGAIHTPKFQVQWRKGLARIIQNFGQGAQAAE